MPLSCIAASYESALVRPGQREMLLGRQAAVGAWRRRCSSSVKFPGAAGTSGTRHTRYELDAEEKNLSEHLDQQVEISGTVDASATSGAAAASVKATPKLKVDSVRMVAAVCAQPQKCKEAGSCEPASSMVFLRGSGTAGDG